jgi:predicted transcriptional regulator
VATIGPADSFSAFLNGGGASISGTATANLQSALPRATAVLAAIQDGAPHSVEDLRTRLNLGVLELADTVHLLESTGLVSVRQDGSSAHPVEVVELTPAARPD